MASWKNQGSKSFISMLLLLHPSVTQPVKPYQVTFCEKNSTPRHPLQYQIRPDENFSSPGTNFVFPVTNDHDWRDSLLQ